MDEVVPLVSRFEDPAFERSAVVGVVLAVFDSPKIPVAGFSC
jgi:hypothetical protein